MSKRLILLAGIGIILIISHDYAMENLRIPVNVLKISANTARHFLNIILYIGWALLAPALSSILIKYINFKNIKRFAVEIIGFFLGLIGFALGFLPFVIIHEYFIEVFRFYDRGYDGIFSILLIGILVHISAIFVLFPVSGILGILGAKVGVSRHLKKGGTPETQYRIAIIWGFAFGFFFNIFFHYFNW